MACRRRALTERDHAGAFGPASRPGVAHGRPFQRQSMRLMDHPVADRIRDAGLANRGVPRGRRQLAGDQRRGPLTPIFNDLQQVAAFRIGERREQPIIDREEIELGVFHQEPGIGSVAATDRELVQQPRRPDVGRGEAMATGALHEGRRQPGLANPGRVR